MAITLTTKVAQVVKAMSSKGTTIFNDRLEDGTRSLKVWGWSENEYRRAYDMLAQARCNVKLVRVSHVITLFNGQTTTRTTIRLHVREPK